MPPPGPRRVAPENLNRAVRRRTVNHEMFHIGIVLRLHAEQGVFDESGLIKGWGDDADPVRQKAPPSQLNRSALTAANWLGPAGRVAVRR